MTWVSGEYSEGVFVGLVVGEEVVEAAAVAVDFEEEVLVGVEFLGVEGDQVALGAETVLQVLADDRLRDVELVRLVQRDALEDQVRHVLDLLPQRERVRPLRQQPVELALVVPLRERQHQQTYHLHQHLHHVVLARQTQTPQQVLPHFILLGQLLAEGEHEDLHDKTPHLRLEELLLLLVRTDL